LRTKEPPVERNSEELYQNSIVELLGNIERRLLPIESLHLVQALRLVITTPKVIVPQSCSLSPTRLFPMKHDIIVYYQIYTHILYIFVGSFLKRAAGL